jgi:hypothetical protein
MSRFQRKWEAAGRRLGLQVDLDYRLQSMGFDLIVPVRLRDFGARRGMLLVTDYSMISPYAEALVDAGFGYSCLSEPAEKSETNDSTLIEVLLDWGWSGSGKPPTWLRQ